MNIFNFEVSQAISTIVLSYFVGWLIGVIIWILRYLMIDLPNSKVKGGDYT